MPFASSAKTDFPDGILVNLNVAVFPPAFNLISPYCKSLFDVFVTTIESTLLTLLSLPFSTNLPEYFPIFVTFIPVDAIVYGNDIVLDLLLLLLFLSDFELPLLIELELSFPDFELPPFSEVKPDILLTIAELSPPLLFPSFLLELLELLSESCLS